MPKDVDNTKAGCNTFVLTLILCKAIPMKDTITCPLFIAPRNDGDIPRRASAVPDQHPR